MEMAATQGRIGPAAPPPLGRWAPGTTMHFFYELICCETYLNFHQNVLCNLDAYIVHFFWHYFMWSDYYPIYSSI